MSLQHLRPKQHEIENITRDFSDNYFDDDGNFVADEALDYLDDDGGNQFAISDSTDGSPGPLGGKGSKLFARLSEALQVDPSGTKSRLEFEARNLREALTSGALLPQLSQGLLSAEPTTFQTQLAYRLTSTWNDSHKFCAAARDLFQSAPAMLWAKDLSQHVPSYVQACLTSDRVPDLSKLPHADIMTQDWACYLGELSPVLSDQAPIIYIGSATCQSRDASYIPGLAKVEGGFGRRRKQHDNAECNIIE